MQKQAGNKGFSSSPNPLPVTVRHPSPDDSPPIQRDVAKLLPRVASVTVRGESMWVVDYRSEGKRKRAFRPTKAKAERFASSLRRDTAKGNRQWKCLPPAEQADLIEAYRLARARGCNLFDALTNAKQGLDNYGPKLSVVIDELLSVKRKAGKSSRYVDNLRIVLGLFANGRKEMRIGRVTLANVETFLDSRSLSYRPTLRARLSTLFKFSIRRGYRLDNPCSRLEPIALTHPTPHILSVTQAAKAVLWLAANRPHALAWFVLSTFCGLRPEEAEKTTEKAINFTEGFVRVEAQTTKVRQRRVVYPKREALTLLKRVLKVGGRLPLGLDARRYALTELRERLHFKRWPKDITRHTAASYWLAENGSAEHVAEMLGHSESVLRKNYKAIVTRQHAKQFWALAAKLAKRL